MLTIPAQLASSALDAAPDAMIIIETSGLILYANRQVSVLFGYSHDEVVGLRVEQLMPERFRVRHLDHRKGFTDNLRVRPMGVGLELFGQRRDGSEFPIEISLSPIHDGGRTLVAAAMRDVTAHKRAEAELLAARQLAEQAREAADRANKAKSRFLATASHDLRQPLQTLALLNGTLRRMLTQHEPLQAITQQDQAIGAMAHLLNTLLDICKLESGAIKPELTDFTVAGLFEELRLEFSGLAASKGLELQVDTPSCLVHSDLALVQQVLRNLISNAIKYTRQGSVCLRCVPGAAHIRIEVVDTGIGIATDQVAYIYDEFYQVGVPTNSRRDGYGLGLNIVQRIAILLDLQLAVRSELGHGSAFSITLPAGQEHGDTADGKAHGTSATPPPLNAQQCILLVEDDPAVRDATRMLLKVEDYRVTAVSSIAEALQRAQTEPIDLLITDYHLGNQEFGTTLIAALRDRLGATLKTVLMTGDTSSAVIGLPSDPYLRIASKPIKADELLTLLRTFPAG